jgi:hypothetical protein
MFWNFPQMILKQDIPGRIFYTSRESWHGRHFIRGRNLPKAYRQSTIRREI